MVVLVFSSDQYFSVQVGLKCTQKFTKSKKRPNFMIDRSISILFSNHLWWWSWFFHPTNISLSRLVWSAGKMTMTLQLFGSLPTLTYQSQIQTWVGSLDHPFDAWGGSNVHFYQKPSFGIATWVWSWCKKGLWEQLGKRGELTQGSPPPTPTRDLGVQMDGRGSW